LVRLLQKGEGMVDLVMGFDEASMERLRNEHTSEERKP
jgi:hypothetical protein